jgi:hypothetical protein
VPSVRIELADGRRIRGFINDRYGPVIDTFRADFLERRDLGAVCSVYVVGRRVVDLWVGLRNNSGRLKQPPSFSPGPGEASRSAWALASVWAPVVIHSEGAFHGGDQTNFKGPVKMLEAVKPGITVESIETAKMDRTTQYNIFLNVVVPLSASVFASFAILQFLRFWNDLPVALVVLGFDKSPIVMTQALVSLSGTYGNRWHLLTSGACISMIIPLVIFFSLQRYVNRGLVSGGTKG